MKKTISFILILLIAFTLSATETRQNSQLQNSDWQHIYIPGTAYIAGEQFFETIGIDRETSEYAALSLTLMANVGKEYYDYRCGGVSSLTDLELTVIGIVTSYYINKGINAILRPQPKYRSYRSYKSYRRGKE